ncbi:FAD-binding oxidoreductase [Mangrovimicrobium sediminis]|uniref:FAD-binding oxidoreductase n=1 Tax=Mangrovimicrobium sediminis TaxID=2562682 RepID=A0A4Z0LTD4_9GAMM|nr:FAD-binding oxidoreductase [Haliea sp. SAOS-164]TGD70560.1 FAD-binding oxidoreductase [Haliea sp. SAOS-164]
METVALLDALRDVVGEKYLVTGGDGGNRVLRWGMTRDMVIGLEAVLADGSVVSSLTKMLKDNAGYNWKHLLIGSEGTLGIVTRAVLRLRPLPSSRQTALLALDDFADCMSVLRELGRVLSGRLSSYELMWDDFYTRMSTAQPHGGAPPLPTGHTYYALVEAMGGDDAADDAQFERVLADLLEEGVIADAVIAQSERERAASPAWVRRRTTSPGRSTSACTGRCARWAARSPRSTVSACRARPTSAGRAAPRNCS